MSGVPAAMRRLVIERPGDHCEYCGIAQISQTVASLVRTVVENESMRTLLSLRFHTSGLNAGVLRLLLAR